MKRKVEVYLKNAYDENAATPDPTDGHYSFGKINFMNVLFLQSLRGDNVVNTDIPKMLICIREKSKKAQRDRIERKPRVPKTTVSGGSKKNSRTSTHAVAGNSYDQDESSEEDDDEDNDSVVDTSTVSNPFHSRGMTGSSYGGNFAHEHHGVGSGGDTYRRRSEDDSALNFSEVAYPVGAPRISGDTHSTLNTCPSM